VKYEWDLDGDGTYEAVSSGPTISHTYSGGAAGVPLPPFLIGLRVTNNAGGNEFTTRSLTVTGASPPPSSSPAVVISSPLPPPQLGESANLARVDGRVLVKTPQSKQFVRVTTTAKIPVGSIVDTTRGTAELTIATAAKGHTQSGKFHAGVFTFTQRRNAVANLDLVGGVFKSCGPGRARRDRQAVSDRRKPNRQRSTVRKLWGDAKGKFEVSGRYSATAVRGTIWLVADRCDGTLTKVRRGSVGVRDFVLHRTVVVRAGETYLAHP
jgi:hypothetical protein